MQKFSLCCAHEQLAEKHSTLQSWQRFAANGLQHWNASKLCARALMLALQQGGAPPPIWLPKVLVGVLHPPRPHPPRGGGGPPALLCHFVQLAHREVSLKMQAGSNHDAPAGVREAGLQG